MLPLPKVHGMIEGQKHFKELTWAGSENETENVSKSVFLSRRGKGMEEKEESLGEIHSHLEFTPTPVRKTLKEDSSWWMRTHIPMHLVLYKSQVASAFGVLCCADMHTNKGWTKHSVLMITWIIFSCYSHRFYLRKNYQIFFKNMYLQMIGISQIYIMFALFYLSARVRQVLFIAHLSWSCRSLTNKEIT